VLARCILAALAWLAPAFDFDGALDQPTGSAVEYYHAGFDHYFMTARQSEITLLDGGAFGGVWAPHWADHSCLDGGRRRDTGDVPPLHRGVPA
jgi:hypothetical protein